MNGGMITSIDELDLNEITFEKMHWEYGTLMSRSVGKRSEKQTYYTKGVKTPIEEIDESVWYSMGMKKSCLITYPSLRLRQLIIAALILIH